MAARKSPLSLKAALLIVHRLMGYEKLPFAFFEDTWETHPAIVRNVAFVRSVAANNLDIRTMYEILIENAPKKKAEGEQINTEGSS